jgi:hypothetical protein
MSDMDLALEINKPNFTVRLYENLLTIDLKETIKNDIQEALENEPGLKQTIGTILGLFAPLHVHLKDIDSANVDKAGAKIRLPHRRDVIIPLEPKESETLVEKLNLLIPEAKEKEYERLREEGKLEKTVEEERITPEEVTPSSGFPSSPLPEPPGIRRKMRDAEKRIADEEEERD